MRVLYLRCVHKADEVDLELKPFIEDGSSPGFDGQTVSISSPDALRDFLLDQDLSTYQILVLGAHGHPSKSGFLVRDEPVRWHDFAALLCGALSKNCSLILFSCYGGYPGIGRAFNSASGPDVIFGPYVAVLSDAMTHAIRLITDWKNGAVDGNKSPLPLVEQVNAWAAKTYFKKYDQDFLRVLWKEGHKICRFPAPPNGWRRDRPKGAIISIRGWKR
jgi:hypothetical protein